MKLNKLVFIGPVLLLLGLLLAAGCSGGGGGAQSGATQEQGGATQAGTAQKAATVTVSKNSELGEILVDGSGQTLYLFEADKGGDSACYDRCAEVWPPLTTHGEPTVGNGISADKLSTISRKNGATQVTYNGRPLYYYAPDDQPGDVKGQELEQFGAEWYAVSPSGDKAEKEGGEGGGSSGGSSDSGSGGY